MEEKSFSKKDLEKLGLLLEEFWQILNEYARKWQYSDEYVYKSKRKSAEINNLFRKNWLLW